MEDALICVPYGSKTQRSQRVGSSQDDLRSSTKVIFSQTFLENEHLMNRWYVD
jgi:hypothetical protein